MKCSKCQFGNPQGMRFCVECGTKLELACPNCNAPNSPDYKFCGECGQSLISPPNTALAKNLSFDEKLAKIQKFLPGGLTEKILSQRDRIEGERRNVTIMFVDMTRMEHEAPQGGTTMKRSVKDVIRVLLVVTALVVWILSSAQYVQAQSPPSSEQAKRIEAMVNKAAALVESKGKAAFSEFRKRDSEWWFGNTYLFAYDQKLNVLLNPAFPQREGTSTHGQTDANGKAFHDEFLRACQTKGSGWVDYMFPKPGQTQPSQKWSYVKAVNVDGTPAIIGAGFYPK